jgi:tRNA(Arg) A34 adenosine deaminase TadA
MTEQDRKFMMRAIELSRVKMQEGCGGPFGAVIAVNGQLVAEGWNRVTSTNDPTAHAEVTAIREACAKLQSFELKNAVIYTSCEPCPMCLSAIYWARIGRIFYANTRADAAAIEFDDDFLYQEIPKKLEDRKIPTTQICHSDALSVFREWSAKQDRIKY